MRDAALEKEAALRALREQAAGEQQKAVAATTIKLLQQSLIAMTSCVPGPLATCISALVEAFDLDSVRALRVAGEAVQHVMRDHEAYITAGSPFRDYEHVVERTAQRVRTELSPAAPEGWVVLFDDEKGAALERAASNAAVQERVRLAEEARRAAELVKQRQQEEQRAAAASAAEAMRRAGEACCWLDQPMYETP